MANEINKTTAFQNNFEIWETVLDDYIIGINWNYKSNLVAVLTSTGRFAIFNHSAKAKQYAIKAHAIGAIRLGISPTENKAVTTGQDGLAKLWNLENGQLINEVRMNALWVEHITWSPNGNYYAIGAGNAIKVFNNKGALIQEYNLHESTVSGIEWRSDSQAFATACYGGVRLFEIEQEIPFQFLEWKNSMLSLSWSLDDKFICCGTQDSRVHFFPIPYSQGSDFEMSGYRGKVKILEWSFDSKYFLTNCWDEMVVWEVSGVAPMGQQPIILLGHKAKITSAKFQSNNAVLASGDETGLLLFYDLTISDKAITGVNLETEISALNWSNDNNFLAIGTANGEVIIMEFSS